MKKLNEIVANELLYELKERWSYDWIKDCVKVKFYANHEMAHCFIGEFYNSDAIGEYLLEQLTVKAFKFTVENNKRFENMFVEITIILNM